MSLPLAWKLKQLGQPAVLVLGDLIQDVEVHGQLTRFAPEAHACPVFRQARPPVIRPGGAGAVAAMVHELGATAHLVRRDAVASRTRYFAGGQQVWRADEDPAPISVREGYLNTDKVWEAVDVGAVLIADYGLGTCTPPMLRAAIDAARHRSILSIVDPARGVPWDRYDGASCVKCNQGEWEAAAERDAENALRFSWSIVTLGAGGISFDRQDGSGYEVFPARPRRAVDVTGAGDQVLAAVGVCVAGGMSWSEACRVAVSASGLKVERRGAQPVTRAEVIVDLLAGVKAIPRYLLDSVLWTARAQQKKIVFTNGCFDVLHAGHVQALQEARAQGDLLIVGLNTDNSVWLNKGPGRPRQQFADRAAALAGLSAVDWIVPFEESEPSDLVHQVRPEVLVKGAEYEGKPIVGGDFVASYGGRVHLAAMRGRLSTTRLLGLAETITGGPL